MTAELPRRVEVAIVGAGLAGLACAGVLDKAGREVHIFEASDGVGGRVRTDCVDGHLLDRGFQVASTAYPELSRQCDVEALSLHRFEPGVAVWSNGRMHRLTDPFRRPTTLWPTLRAPVGSLADRMRILRQRRRLTRGSVVDLLRAPDASTLDGLRRDGFSASMIDGFFRPLAGGFALDPDLAESRRMFDVIMRCLVTGDAAVPAAGMRAIPDQLAARLSPGCIHLGCRVAAINATTLRFEGGESVEAGTVVVATEGPVASELLGLPPVASKPTTAVWFGAHRAPSADRCVMLDGSGQGPAMNVAVMSNVAPVLRAARPGNHRRRDPRGPRPTRRDPCSRPAQTLVGHRGRRVGASTN